MTSVAIIQPKPGIGDLVWHLPFIRAIAAASPGGEVTLLIPPSSHAHELLAAEPSVARRLYFNHHGSEFQRGIHLVRLIAMLREPRLGRRHSEAPTPNQPLQPTAARPGNLHMTASTLKFAAQFGLVSGG